MTGSQAVAALITLTLTALTSADAPKPLTAADKVKASAHATKTNTAGKQIVTVTLTIEKGTWLYAHPVRHNNEFLDALQTTVTFSAREKVTATVTYPPGRTRRDGVESYHIYEGTVTIKAQVVRSPGDASPLEIRIPVHGTTDRSV